MPSFEFAFATPDLDGPDDPRLDRVLEQCDATVSSHSGLTLTTLVVDGPDAVAAGRRAAALLIGAGLRPERLVPDLVDRSEIAERCGVTRQAVSNWARGARRAAAPFPSPYAAELWLWGDVLPWLRGRGLLEESVSYPTWREHGRIENELQSEPTPAWSPVAANCRSDRRSPVRLPSRSTDAAREHAPDR